MVLRKSVMLLVVSFTHLYSYNEYYNQYIDQDDANKRGVFEDISTWKNIHCQE